jgi:SAM-dependent methyltransferase
MLLNWNIGKETDLPNLVQPRDWLVKRLSENLNGLPNTYRLNRILVLGGGPGEPELGLFEKGPAEIFFAGIDSDGSDDNFSFVDLNLEAVIHENFDLVICNQVLEHLYNLNAAFSNLKNLVAPGGFLWITCPANNFRHGSPEYFSAGYSWEFLVRNLENAGFVNIDSGELSSKRIYLYRHLLKIWPTNGQIQFPLLAYFGVKGNILQKFLYNLRTIAYRVIIGLGNRNWVLNGPNPIETFGFFKKAK